MKPVRLHPEAESEMIAAAVYYEAQQANLGSRFLASVQDAVDRVASNPSQFPFVVSNVRRCLVKTFPFGLLFRDDSDSVLVMAVMHLRRDPDYWRNR